MTAQAGSGQVLKSGDNFTRPKLLFDSGQCKQCQLLKTKFSACGSAATSLKRWRVPA
jgi:hypothetical protein